LDLESILSILYVTRAQANQKKNTIGFKNLNGLELYKTLESLELSEDETYGMTGALKTVPGKRRGMTDKAAIVMAIDGKWKAMTGWTPMVNLYDWAKANPALYEKNKDK